MFVRVTLLCLSFASFFFFFNDTATTEIYTLSLHDALPSWPSASSAVGRRPGGWPIRVSARSSGSASRPRSEEHTSELQSHSDLVCRLLLEKKKKTKNIYFKKNNKIKKK